MKHEVENRFTGDVQFISDINCNEDTINSVRLGLAVKRAIENGADLRGADLRDANLRGTNLRGTNLRGTNLRGADLRGADLRGANLQDADLQDANLQYANLQGANLLGTNLRDANLQDADLRGADLRGTNLRDANLQYANLRGAENLCAPVPIGIVGEELRTGYAMWDCSNKEVRVILGCFNGTEKEAIEAVSKKYGARSGYAMMVRAACKVAKERKVLNPTKEIK